MPIVPSTTDHLSDTFLDRVKNSYRLSRQKGSKSESMWVAISKIKAPVHEALEAPDNETLRRIFSDPCSSNLYYGMDFLAEYYLTQDPKAKGHELEEPGRCYQQVLKLAEALGVRRWLPADNELAKFYYPEGHKLTPEIDEILLQIGEALGFELDFPNPFPNEIGATSASGIISLRPIHAIYQTYRIKQELRGSPNQSVLEVGPGMGRTAYYAFKAGFKDYTTIDLPIGIVGQACFLGAVLGPDSIWMMGDDPNLAENRIKLLPSTASLPDDARFGLVLNVDSITEMDEASSARYAAWIASHTDVFVSINHETNGPTVVDLGTRFFASADARRWLYWMRSGWVEEVFWFNTRSNFEISSSSTRDMIAEMAASLKRPTIIERLQAVFR